MPDKNALKNFYLSHPVKSRFLLGLAIFFLLLLILRISLSPALSFGLRSWLKDEGLQVSIEDISFNITRGSFSLHNAVGSRDGKPLFRVGLVELDWRWTPLSEKTIEISKVTLDGLEVTIKQYSDVLIIGGVHIPLNAADANTANDIPLEEAPAARDLAEPWAAALNEVSLGNLKVCYLQHHAARADSSDKTLSMDYCIGIDEMTWQGSISYARNRELLNKNELPVASSGDFQLSGLQVQDNRLNHYVLHSQANTLENVVITGLNDIHIDRINMQQLSALQRPDQKHRDAVRFDTLQINNIRLSELNRLQMDSIEIARPGLYIVRHKNTEWEYQQWLPTFPASANDNTDKAATNNSRETNNAFDLAIDNIHISGADWCYQDNSTNLYYCLTYNDMNWQGKLGYSTRPKANDDIALKVKGDLTLAQTLVHNHSIDRTLLKLDLLHLKGVTLDGINRAALGKIELDKLAALQRGQKDDDYTLGFDTLDIQDVQYLDRGLNVDTIKLDQLQLLVSKNTDGSWEYNKWLPEQSKTDSDENARNSSTSASSDADDKQAKPLAIALNRLDINTDKKLLFIDNSTQPPMHIGLQKLDLDLQHLYSSKPDSDTRFKLFAKTTRHGTIELAGIARPFARKISFDAEGKLKGFDLRAATPATKKAIGHIIQSGQMDADLKLLAVDGKLDSNISLALYQFHIKALNKKDAEELDKKFGMPLNKTLVLLRNKDGSIHLDIPITGDVSNPNFNPTDAIFKATSKAAAVTLITFYTPYGLAYAGGNILFDLATALNFEPINFAPGSAELTDNNTAQLDKLSELLTAKPGVHLTLCGATSNADTYALFPDLKPGKADAPAPALSAEQRAALEQLARQRQINSKNYLVKEKGIEHDRLILCAPEHNTDKDAVSGVEIII